MIENIHDITLGEADKTGEDWLLMLGNSLERLKELPDNSVDSIVTDPPYGLSNDQDITPILTAWLKGDDAFIPSGKGFMGKEWDAYVPPPAIWKECLRVLKPGGHLLAFFGSRTQDIGALSIRLAGFEIRDSIAWVYGSGFPKNHDISKAIDKQAGESSSPEAKQWDGWGTALKPAIEPIVVARKPFSEKTVAANVLKWGTGGINIDASRIPHKNATDLKESTQKNQHADFGTEPGGNKIYGDYSMVPMKNYNPVNGRFPANIILDENAAEELDRQTEDKLGGASKFFYVAKASKSDRNEGLEEFPVSRPDLRTETGMGTFAEKGVQPQQNHHPTVKPTTLMRYLVKLVTPPGGVVLDPFTGSGSTGKASLLEGFKFIGVELTEEYIPIIEARLKHVLNNNIT